MTPFGREYALRATWSKAQRAYIWSIGVVDLPTRTRARAVLGAARNVQMDAVLDVGAGTGVYSYYCSRDPRCRVVALDVDESRLSEIAAVAKQLGRANLEVAYADGAVLGSFDPGSWTHVLAIEVLQYLPDLPGALRSMYESLRPGGWMVAHVPLRKELMPFERRLFDDANLALPFIEAGFEPPSIRPTFGRLAHILCDVASWCSVRPLLLAACYPLLLAVAAMTPVHPASGTCRLIVARRPCSASSGATTGR